MRQYDFHLYDIHVTSVNTLSDTNTMDISMLAQFRFIVSFKLDEEEAVGSTILVVELNLSQQRVRCRFLEYLTIVSFGWK